MVLTSLGSMESVLVRSNPLQSLDAAKEASGKGGGFAMAWKFEPKSPAIKIPKDFCFYLDLSFWTQKKDAQNHHKSSIF